MLDAQNLTKRFGDFLALNDVSFSVPSGTIYGLLGPNGAGKTTLIRILTQITGADSGQVLLHGSQMVPSDNARIGYLPEERGLYRKMKVWEQALYLSQLKGLSKNQGELNLKHWFKELQMLEWSQKPVESLSKGMQQRLQFVVAVAHNPDLIILDEPFSGFDPINAEELKKQVLRLKSEGKTIVLSTHNMSSVEELCDNIALINKGETILSGSITDVKKKFSKSLYKIQFVGSKVAFANSLGHAFEIVQFEEKHEATFAIIKSHEVMTSNALLKMLIEHVSVVSFQEQIPSMHDIFIDQVTKETGAKSVSL